MALKLKDLIGMDTLLTVPIVSAPVTAQADGVMDVVVGLYATDPMRGHRGRIRSRIPQTWPEYEEDMHQDMLTAREMPHSVRGSWRRDLRKDMLPPAEA